MRACVRVCVCECACVLVFVLVVEASIQHSLALMVKQALKTIHKHYIGT